MSPVVRCEKVPHINYMISACGVRPSLSGARGCLKSDQPLKSVGHGLQVKTNRAERVLRPGRLYRREMAKAFRHYVIPYEYTPDCSGPAG
jgi:hypothetical protein